MNISELIKTRRATPPRFLDTREVEKEKILQLLENANWAPTHKNTEPWRFKIYTGEAKRKLANQIYLFLSEKIKSGAEINQQKVEKLKINLQRVPVMMVVIMAKDEATRIPEWEEIAAVSMAIQNMWLTATEMGLGAFFASPQFMPLLEDVLGVKSNQKALGFFSVGYIALDFPSPGRGDIADKVEWI